MLAQARSREDTADFTFSVGTAEKLDFPDESIDLVFSVDVIHHVRDRASFFREALRVLRTGGRLCTVTESSDDLAARVHASYFPATLAVEVERYPSIDTLRQELGGAGFNAIDQEHVELPLAVTSAHAYRARAFSSLHFISDEQLADGLRAMETDLERRPIRSTSRYTLLWARVSEMPQGNGSGEMGADDSGWSQPPLF
jgi:ubiquinone/menaquinone biosynthesis C-methylase UbiE